MARAFSLVRPAWAYVLERESETDPFNQYRNEQMKSSKANVEDFFNDLGLADPEKHQIALTLRQEIKRLAETSEERVMYGGYSTIWRTRSVASSLTRTTSRSSSARGTNSKTRQACSKVQGSFGVTSNSNICPTSATNARLSTLNRLSHWRKNETVQNHEATLLDCPDASSLRACLNRTFVPDSNRAPDGAFLSMFRKGTNHAEKTVV